VLAALAGGVGAARFLRGLVRVVPPHDVTAIVNVADDEEFHGLHVSPDLDSVTYTLAGASDDVQGWGLAGETFTVLDALDRFDVPTWFRLGDRDLATHLFRTVRLRAGEPLSAVTAQVAAAFAVRTRLLPVTDDRVSTRIAVEGPSGTVELAMQEWFVRDRARPAVRAVRFEGASDALPAPGVLEALRTATAVIVCPSNPVISIDPILAIPGVREALRTRRDRVVGISPIVGGAPVKGPADKLMRPLGIDVSCVGVAAHYADFCGTFVIDATDADRRAEVEEQGVRAVVTDTIMQSPEIAAALAERALHAVA